MAYRETEHPGVTVYRRSVSGKTRWYAKWQDPISKKWTHQSLAALKFKTKTAALPWLRSLSKRLAKQRQDVALGILPAAGPSPAEKAAQEKLETTWDKLYESYVAAFAQGRTEKVVNDQKTRMKPWRDWIASKSALYPTTGSLDIAALVDYRDWLDAQSKRRPIKKGGRGDSAKTKKPLSANAKDAYRRVAMAYLNWSKQRGYLRLRRDEISDSLPRFKTEHTLPEVLRAADYRQIVAALKSRETKKFKASRAEKHLYHKQQQSEHATNRYKPLAPLVLVLALTGMRLGEAIHLKWEDVDFDRNELLVRSDPISGWKVKTRS